MKERGGREVTKLMIEAERGENPTEYKESSLSLLP